jgi:predicted DCC family thiol-disulfide oxidoreductase YuxK
MTTEKQDPSPAPETIFYDGHCGLCHRWVRFVVKRDTRSEAFRFAPLGGERFSQLVPQPPRENVPDSIVVLTSDGRMLVRSAAALHILSRLGRFWSVTASLCRIVPAFARDWLYDLIARIRHRLFRRPDNVCPVLPPELRERFDA